MREFVLLWTGIINDYDIIMEAININPFNGLKYASEQLKDNLFRSAGVDQSTVLSSDGVYQTANHQRIPTKDYFLEFKSTNTAQQAMRVRWITNPTMNGGIWLYQVSILHTGPVEPDVRAFFLAEDRANFFDEFHPN